LISCKDFLKELNEYLDDLVDPAVKQHWQKHVDECPNCFVIVDTTRRTLQVYKGMQEEEVPAHIKNRLIEALERKMAARRGAQS
jgi:hypothetical protein